MEDPDIYDAETVKDMIVKTDPNFYLVDAQDPRETYKILWYRLSQSGRRCKVDILLPGPQYLDIPFVPREDITYTKRSRTPLMPLLTLILMKLKGWEDHRTDHRARMREKADQDVRDIAELLYIALQKGQLLQFEDEAHLWSEWFWERGQERIREYMHRWPCTIEIWMEVFVF